MDSDCAAALWGDVDILLRTRPFKWQQHVERWRGQLEKTLGPFNRRDRRSQPPRAFSQEGHDAVAFNVLVFIKLALPGNRQDPSRQQVNHIAISRSALPALLLPTLSPKKTHV